MDRLQFQVDDRVCRTAFFCGFSGGPKMVAPGLAGLDTVMELHNVKRIGHPNATWGVTREIRFTTMCGRLRALSAWTSRWT
jgi:hypothetical protein